MHLEKTGKSWFRMAYALGTLVISAALTFNPGGARAQTSPRAPSQQQVAGSNGATSAKDNDHRIDDLQKQLSTLSAKVDSELNATKTKYEALTNTTDRAFGVLALLGVLGGVFVGLSSRRSRKIDERYRADYEHERAFYEKRAKAADELQHKERSFALDSARSAAVVSNNLLSEQLNGIQKLGGVIDLVQKTFQLQHARESQIDTIASSLHKMQDQLNSQAAYSREQYRRVRTDILTFSRRSRLAWPQLNEGDARIITRALSTFEQIPPSTLDTILTENKQSRYELAQVYQLLGVGAFYTNDVAVAARHLTKAKEAYGTENVPREFEFSQAFCSHFLGLIEKNWLSPDLTLDQSLQSAKDHLELANLRLENNTNEFLTPLTLVEVLSYSQRTREEAQTRLAEIIARLETLLRDGKIDPNQRNLLGRAYLFRGNLDYLGAARSDALSWYEKSFVLTHSAYSRLSMAQCENDATKKIEAFQEGLVLLKRSPLRKNETYTKITALAWAVVATRELGLRSDYEEYVQQLKEASALAQPVGERIPLFFCPTTKLLVAFDTLRENLGV